MSSPAVAAALALAGEPPVSGREAIVAIARGQRDLVARGSVAPGQFHRRGFHPTGLFAPFGITYLAGKLLGSEAETMARGAGICGSVAAGLLECWVDGTQSKFLHSGFAAQSGIAAALLAQAGVTGPPTVLEGRFGLFASHLQHPETKKDLERVTGGLGGHVGEPQRLVQAVSRGARAPSVRGRGPARAGGARNRGRQTWRTSSARSRSSTCRSSVSRSPRSSRRRPIPTRGSACSTRWPRRCTRGSWGRARIRRRTFGIRRSLRWRSASAITSIRRFPGPGPVQGSGSHHAARWPRDRGDAGT